MREKRLIRVQEKNKAEAYLAELSLEANQDTQDIDAHLPEMLKNVGHLLTQALNEGRYVGQNGGGDGGIDLICKRDGVTLL